MVATESVESPESRVESSDPEEVVATESVESPESRVESSGPEEVVATESLPEEAKREDAVTAEGLPEAAESMAVEETAPEQGSWRGEGEPPAGFSIKGKESSMLFHRPDSSMYNRTKAEVWFNTEEAAQAAGFTAAKTHPNSRESTVESREQDDTPDSGLSTQDSSDSDSEGGAD